MLELNGKKIESIYFNNQKINRYYFNGVMYEFYKPYIDYKWSDVLLGANSSQVIPNSGIFTENSGTLNSGVGVRFNGIDQKIEIKDIVFAENSGTIAMLVSMASATTTKYIISGQNTNSKLAIRAKSDRTIEVGIGDSFITTSLVYPSLTSSYWPCILTWTENTATLKINNSSVTINYQGNIDLSILTFAKSNMIGETEYTACTIKDFFLFNRALTPEEIEEYTVDIHGFFDKSLMDSNCLFSMPMCESSSTAFVRNYKTGLDYQISNFTTTSRSFRLSSGFQAILYNKNEDGTLLNRAESLVADGAGYFATNYFFSTHSDFSIECIFHYTPSISNIFGIARRAIASDILLSVDLTDVIFTFGSPVKTFKKQIDLSNPVCHIVIVWDAIIKTYSIYLNNELFGAAPGLEVQNSGFPINLLANRAGALNSAKYGIKIDKFKIHLKKIK